MNKPYKKREQLVRSGLPGSDSPEYRTWEGMVHRCTRPTNSRFRRYGGRGIKVCARWLEKFSNFYADMGPRPAGMTLDRTDNDGDYCPENCRWIPHGEQQSNTRRNRWVELDGERKTVAQWERHYGLQRGTVNSRLAIGWDIERAIKTPKEGWTPERRAVQAQRMLAAVVVREQRRRGSHE